uniref:Uncharacterized protein n=1 Tax=Anguilla anguilla TaxID=7936 RepID=A0A0E9WRJ8_ANGAN
MWTALVYSCAVSSSDLKKKQFKSKNLYIRVPFFSTSDPESVRNIPTQLFLQWNTMHKMCTRVLH